MKLTRRGFLGGGVLACAGWPAWAAAPARVAITDWALLETSLALDAVPMAAVELVLYRQLAVEPALPDSVADLGLRGSINFELLATLQPDMIFRSNFSAWAAEQLAQIAPVRELSIFKRGENPYPKAEAAMRSMADELGLASRAADYIGMLEAELAGRATAMRPHTSRPLLIINLGDSRHFRVFGEDSIFGEVAKRLGFRNAWNRRTSYSATAPVGIEKMAETPDATVVVIGPVPPDARLALPESALWKAMPPVREKRTFFIDPVNAFGGLPSGRRFARLLHQALDGSA